MEMETKKTFELSKSELRLLREVLLSERYAIECSIANLEGIIDFDMSHDCDCSLYVRMLSARKNRFNSISDLLERVF